MAPQLVPEPPVGDLLVDRLAGEDRAHRLGAHLGGAAHHALALGPVGVHQHAGDPVDVGEQERGALILGDEELGGVGDALPSGPRDQTSQNHACPSRYVRRSTASVIPRRTRPRTYSAASGGTTSVSARGAELEQPQDLVDVALDAGRVSSRRSSSPVESSGMFATRWSVRPRASSGARGRSSAASRAHRRRHAALLGELRTGRRQAAHLQPIVLPAITASDRSASSSDTRRARHRPASSTRRSIHRVSRARERYSFAPGRPGQARKPRAGR